MPEKMYTQEEIGSVVTNKKCYYCKFWQPTPRSECKTCINYSNFKATTKFDNVVWV